MTGTGEGPERRASDAGRARWWLRMLFLSGMIAAPVTVARSSAETSRFPVPGIAFQPERYICYRASAPLAIDGRGDEAAWQAAPWTGPFVDIEGDLQPPPALSTRAKLLWDERDLYIYAEMEEPGLWATYDRRDAIIFHEHDFEVFLDPDGDTHLYYELEINALNTVWDLLLVRPYRDGGPAVHAWDIAGLRTAVHLDGTLNDPSDVDAGWSVEIAMPWEILKECAGRPLPPRDTDQWRVNFSRVEWKLDAVDGRYVKRADPSTGRPLPEQNWVWSPQGLINMHYPEMWGVVQFSTLGPAAGGVRFHADPEEPTRWALRRLYYAQKERKESGRPFTADLAELGWDPIAAGAGAAARPRVELTSSGFEALLELPAGAILHIDHLGRTWRSQP